MTSEPKISILVASRFDAESSVFDSEILIPVRGGAVFETCESKVALNKDSTGDNISDRNRTFCELTVQYWAWKNVSADYYGLFHYRRYLNFSDTEYPLDKWGNVNEGFIDSASAQKYGLTDARLRELIPQYDLILPRPLDVTTLPDHPQSLREHWPNAKNLHDEDLETMLSVVQELAPDFYGTAVSYLDGHDAYFCNMQVMKKDLFYAYCEWLFPILFELEKRIDISHYSVQAQRTIGHLAERLLGIYISYLKNQNPELRMKELQIVLFSKPQVFPKSLPSAYPGKKNVVPVFTVCNKAFAPSCSVMLSSLIRHAAEDHFYDIVILEKDFDRQTERTLLLLTEGLCNVSLRFFDVDYVISSYNLKPSYHIPIETYFRFIAQDALPDYDKILYLDGDMICRRDVAELFDGTDVSDYMLAAVSDADMIGFLTMDPADVPYAVPDRVRYLTQELHMEDPFSYFQAGVLVLNNAAMRKAHSLQEWMSFCEAGYLFMDQDVLNRYCAGQVKYLDMAWNVLADNGYRVPVLIENGAADIYRAYHEARKNPYIIHYAGKNKPWVKKGVDLEREFWECARFSPYYEELLFNVMENEKNKAYTAGQNSIGVRQAAKRYLKKQVNRFAPEDTARRKLLRSIKKSLRP